jgi:anti-sigma B factor antagonist
MVVGGGDDGGRTVVPYPLRGEIDLQTAPALARDLLSVAANSGDDVVLDCSAMTFIDSSGLRALVSVAHALSDEHRKLVLMRVRPACRRPIEITGLDKVFRVLG